MKTLQNDEYDEDALLVWSEKGGGPRERPGPRDANSSVLLLVVIFLQSSGDLSTLSISIVGGRRRRR